MKWSLLLCLCIVIHVSVVCSSSVKRNKSKSQDKNNSINYLYGQLMDSPTSFITSMLHDATLPVFAVMGIASIASLMTNSGKDETSSNSLMHSRSRRAVSSSQSIDNLVKILNNVQRAIEQYSHIEEAILNDLDDSAKREFDSKSSD